MATDNRSAYGAALEDLARLNNSGKIPKIVGFTCDLEGSVKMDGLHKVSENAFFECGIQEHHTATASGAISKEGFAVFFSTFGVFGVTEVFNQIRLNDINDNEPQAGLHPCRTRRWRRRADASVHRLRGASPKPLWLFHIHARRSQPDRQDRQVRSRAAGQLLCRHGPIEARNDSRRIG